jgi:hypothetical protein
MLMPKMYACVHVWMRIHIHTYVRIHIHTYTHTCRSMACTTSHSFLVTCLCAYTHPYLHTHRHTYIPQLRDVHISPPNSLCVREIYATIVCDCMHVSEYVSEYVCVWFPLRARVMRNYCMWLYVCMWVCKDVTLSACERYAQLLYVIVCMCVCIWVYACDALCVRGYAQLFHVCMRGACEYVCKHACMWVCTHVILSACEGYAQIFYVCMRGVCEYVCMYVCMYVWFSMRARDMRNYCMYVCMYVCTYVSMYACDSLCVRGICAKFVCGCKRVYVGMYTSQKYPSLWTTRQKYPPLCTTFVCDCMRVYIGMCTSQKYQPLWYVRM